jgi:ABC-type glycerol-3-phosphate transport system substrate-binding protein
MMKHSRKLAVMSVAVVILIAIPLFSFGQNVEVIYWGHANHIKCISGIIPEFEKANPTIKITAVPTAETEKKLLTSIMAGAGAPDVGYINANLLGAFKRKEGAGIVDLSKTPYNGMTLSKDFVPYIFNQLVTPGKKLLGLPLDVGTLAFYYRRSAFQAAGIDPNKFKSWDDFIAAGKKLRENGQYIVESASDLFYNIRAADNTGVFDENGRLQLASPSYVNALRVVLALRAADADAQIEPWSAESQVGMKDVKVVGYVQPSWYGLMMNVYAPDSKGDWAVAPLPNNAAITMIDMGVQVIPEQSKHKTQAWKFMQAVTASAKGAVLGMKSGGFFWAPSYMPAWTEVAKLSDPMFGGQNTMKIFIDSTRKLSPKPFVVTDKDDMAVNLLMEKVREALKTPDVDPQAFLQQATQEIVNQL